jgi:hypothetical protein
MRTKLFLAFLFIIILAFISNIVFERLILKDFEDFLSGTEEDRIYWIMASVEGSYRDDTWNRPKLYETLHWGLMLGLESYVVDADGNQVLSSAEVLFHETSLWQGRVHVVPALC